MNNYNITETNSKTIDTGVQNYENIKKYTGFLGRFLCFFGAAIKIKDEKNTSSIL